MRIDFRPKYRELSNGERVLMSNIKSAAERLDLLLDALPADQGRFIAIARTHLETAVMFAVKAATAPPLDDGVSAEQARNAGGRA